MTLHHSARSDLLDAILAGGDIDVIRTGREPVLQALIEAQVAEGIGADRYERDEARRTWRNGYGDRLLTTEPGTWSARSPSRVGGASSPRSSRGAGCWTGPCSR